MLQFKIIIQILKLRRIHRCALCRVAFAPLFKTAKYLMVFIILLVSGCGDNKETRLQRFLMKGNEQMKKGNDAQAIGYYNAALELDSCFADSWNNLGTLYFRQQNYDEALESYNNAVNCREGYTEAYMNRANTWYELKQFQSALKDLDKVEEKAPDTTILHFSRGC